MPYVRIDDGAMTHPKILRLSDRGFRLWVWGLCYSQMHLTDGYIPLAAIPSKLKASVPLLLPPNPILWEVTTGGFQVHDYAEWNDVKATVQKNRKDAKDRMEKRRAEKDRRDVRDVGSGPNNTHVRSGTFAPNVLVSEYVSTSGSGISERESEGKPPPILRTHRNCMGLCSERICLLQRQFEDFVGRIGGGRAAAELRVKRWAEDVLVAWNEGDQRDSVMQGDTFKWWNARYDEWQGTPAAHAKGAATLPDASAFQWTCPHTPRCPHRAACAIVAARPA